MELTATKEQLLPLLMRAAAASRGGPLPVLEHLLLQPGDTLTVTGTDMETEIIASGDFPGGGQSVALPGRKLINIVRNLPDGADISIILTAKRCTIKSGRSRYVLETMPADSFPSFSRDGNAAAVTIRIGADVLLRALSRVRFAAAKNDSRYYLNGVYVSIQAGSLLTVASDGHRIAVCETAIEGADGRGVILPNRGTDEMMQLLKGCRGDVTFSVSQGCAEVVTSDTSFATKLVYGAYPDWRRVVPKDYTSSFTVARLAMAGALRRLAVLANEKFCGVDMELDGSTLVLRLNNAAGENAEEQIELANVEGDQSRQRFNTYYLINALDVAETDRVRVEITKTCGIRITDTADTGWQSVVMPMRLSHG